MIFNGNFVLSKRINKTTTIKNTIKMKKLLFIIIIATIGSFQTNAQFSKGIQGTENWLYNWSNFKLETTDYRAATDILTGTITTNTTLVKNKTYQLIGQVYVTNNAVLTIEPGTVIRGDKATASKLIITQGAQIIAEGTETAPIIFTSNKNIMERTPGDWGGIVLLGEAPINNLSGVSALGNDLNPSFSKYAGDKKESNSGILKHVRIEFAGNIATADKYQGALILAAVGSKTKIESVQVSYAKNDSFEIFGGQLNLKNLVSYKAMGDDFDFTQGTQAAITNSIAVRNPYSSDIYGSRCIEIDSYDTPEGTDFTKPFTKVVASNMTFINTEANDQGLVKEAINIKENTYLTFENSIVSGFSSPIMFAGKIKSTPDNLSKIVIQNILINNCKEGFETEFKKTDSFETAINNWYNVAANKIKKSDIGNETLFINSNLKNNPDFRISMENTLVEN